MDFAWESICNFGSLRERDCFLAWMRDQIANGVAEEIEAPAGFDASERWFRHIPTGSLWRLVPAENLYGPASGLLTTRPPKTRAASVGGLISANTAAEIATMGLSLRALDDEV